MKKDCWWSESAKSGKDTASLETPVTLAVSTTTEPPITGMLMQSDDSKAVPADSSQWLYSVTNCETVSKAWQKAWEENQRIWSGTQGSHWTTVHHDRQHDDLLAHTERYQFGG